MNLAQSILVFAVAMAQKAWNYFGGAFWKHADGFRHRERA